VGVEEARKVKEDAFCFEEFITMADVHFESKLTTMTMRESKSPCHVD
jgi:hypothetical protein